MNKDKANAILCLIAFIGVAIIGILYEIYIEGFLILLMLGFGWYARGAIYIKKKELKK